MKIATLKTQIEIAVCEELPTVNECGDIEYCDNKVLQRHTLNGRAAAVSYMKLWLAHWAEKKPGAVFHAQAVEHEYDPSDNEWYPVAVAFHHAGDDSKYEWHRYG